MIKAVRRVVRAKRIETVSGYIRNGEHKVLERMEFHLSCGHTCTAKPRDGRRIPLKMQCRECG